MPLKPLRECKVRGGRELTRDGYWPTHADGKQQEAKYYNKHVRDKQSTSFYKSREWEQTRQLVLMRDNYLCQSCLKLERFIPTDMVHHILELDLNNLESMCISRLLLNITMGNNSKLKSPSIIMKGLFCYLT
ncbi:HNH endonuclease [Bacillus safensis]|uniref:HNH endonuclease n=1 Tax=Bacillus safensis TaxID=561879 RepID=UPI00384E4FA5